MSRKPDFENISAPGGWNPGRPYDELPLLPPPVDLATAATLVPCIEARAALAELKQAARLINNPQVLINTLPLLEAQASSAIEHVVTTNDRLFRHVQAETTADPATKEALRHRHALLEGFASLEARPLGTRTAELICSRVKDASMRVRRVPGTALRTAGGAVVYTPPEGETRLRNLLSDWERFMHGVAGGSGSEETPVLDVLIRMAVGHYQFEAIHPFTDGNGRTGRVLNSLFLVEQGLLSMPILHLSRYINFHKADYYRLLLDVTKHHESGDGWIPWIQFILRGVTETALWTVEKIDGIRALTEETASYVRMRLPKLYSRELVDVISEQPYCRIANLVAVQVAARQAASRYLKALVTIGVLHEQKAGREKLFVNDRLLRMLTTESNTFPPYHSEGG